MPNTEKKPRHYIWEKLTCAIGGGLTAKFFLTFALYYFQLDIKISEILMPHFPTIASYTPKRLIP